MGSGVMPVDRLSRRVGPGGVAASMGARLLVRPLVGPPIALPLSADACLALAIALLDPDDGAGRAAPPESVRASDPVVAVWWALVCDGAAERDWVAALDEDLVVAVVGGDGRSRVELPTAGGRVGAEPSSAGEGARWAMPDAIAWDAFVAATRICSSGPADDQQLIDSSARALRARLDAGAGARLPAAEACAGLPRGEAVVLGRAIRLRREHDRLAAGFAAEVEAARLEGLRSLAYGAGHEINNPLANIAARGQALLVDETDPRRRRRLATIVDQAFRARDMIGGLMLCARPPVPCPVSCDARAIVSGVMDSLAPRAGDRGVRVEGPADGAAPLVCDPALLSEAVRAIVLNAFDAVGDGGEVAVRVTVERVPGGDERSEIVIAVDDDGPGMDAETRRAAFDPFYSGREAGRGIGFGLTKARRFVIASGGAVEVGVSALGGTRVTVRMPAAMAVAARE